jgi:hypothetical protein
MKTVWSKPLGGGLPVGLVVRLLSADELEARVYAYYIDVQVCFWKATRPV